MSTPLVFTSFHSRLVAFVIICILFLLSSICLCNAQLSSSFYDQTCPNALPTIRTVIRQAVSRERRMAASLIRLHFHDCFVQGCDASILLNDTPSMIGEQNAAPNRDSARGYEVIQRAKSEIEKICPGVVSCADILTVAARDASFAVGGPSWTVKLGRRDSTSASQSLAEREIPHFQDNLGRLISIFSNKGLNARDLVALSGSHTIGQSQCTFFRNRIHNQSNIDAGFASRHRRNCPTSGGNGNLASLDLVTPNSFDNNYFKNLIQRKGLLETDQVLFNGGSTDNIVLDYSRNPTMFKSDFAAAMIKMGDIEPLTGLAGQIRNICSVVN